MSVLVLCPSRGRPQALREAAESLMATRRLGSTRFMAVVDLDDPLRDEYTRENLLYQWLIVSPQEKGMVAALNHAVKDRLELEDTTIFGFIGDDHRFRTDGWDMRVETALRKKPAFVYANDGFQGVNLPTQVFISRKIVEALGYFALPDCQHLFVDNAWKDLGNETHSLTYLNDVLIEHMHPAAGKAPVDEGYVRVNAPDMYGRDGAAFSAWRESPRFAEDVERVRAALPRPHTVAA